RLAIAPEIAQVMTTGSSRVTPCLPPVDAFDAVRGHPARGNRSASPRSYGNHARALPGTLHVLARGHLERPTDRGAGLARVDHIIDHVVARRDVDIDDLLELVDQLLSLRSGVLGLLHLLAEDDLDRALRPHHTDLRRRP